jgi:hypothetical protein
VRLCCLTIIAALVGTCCVRGRQRCCQRNQRLLPIRLSAIVRHALRGRPLHLAVYAILGCSCETAAIQGPAAFRVHSVLLLEGSCAMTARCGQGCPAALVVSVQDGNAVSRVVVSDTYLIAQHALHPKCVWQLAASCASARAVRPLRQFWAGG